MARSLPGMVRLLNTTVSPGPMAMLGCVSMAIRASAERGSPWLPVTIISRFSSGTVPAWSSGTNSGMPRR